MTSDALLDDDWLEVDDVRTQRRAKRKRTDATCFVTGQSERSANTKNTNSKNIVKNTLNTSRQSVENDDVITDSYVSDCDVTMAASAPAEEESGSEASQTHCDDVTTLVPRDRHMMDALNASATQGTCICICSAVISRVHPPLTHLPYPLY